MRMRISRLGGRGLTRAVLRGVGGFISDMARELFLKLTSVISGGNFEIGDSDATRNGSFGGTAGYAA